MFKALVAGVPSDGQNFIQEALTTAFGDVTIQEVNVDIDRLEVREAFGDSTVVFVSFDGVSEGRSASFAEALIKSDKYHAYKDLKSLADYLNNTYGTSIVAPEEHDLSFNVSDNAALDAVENDALAKAKMALKERAAASVRPEIASAPVAPHQGIAREFEVPVTGSTILQSEFDEIAGKLAEATLTISNLEGTIHSKELQIENLSSQLEEERLLSGGDGGSERIIQLEEELRAIRSNLTVAESQLRHATTNLKADETKFTKIKADLEEALRERDTALRSQTSTTILMGEMTRENELLRAQLTEVETLRAEAATERTRASTVEADNRALSNEIRRLTEEVATKEALLEAQRNAGMSPTEEANLRSELARLRIIEERVSTFEKEMNDYAAEIEKENEDLKARLESSETDAQAARLVMDENERLGKQLEVANQTIIDRDEQIISLRTQSEENNESVAESQSAVEYASRFRESMFGKMHSTALPKTTPPSIDLGSSRYPNIMFVFAGNNESFMDVYPRLRLISDGFGSKGIKGIVVDASAESNLDYEFRTRLEPKTDWLERGGSLEGKIRPAEQAKNVWLLGFGVGGYMNESYLLTVDWNKRLNELNNSGYKVIMYMGSLGSLVGQVLYHSVAGRGRTRVYAKGIVSSVRSLYFNMKQLGSKQNTVVQIYDFNKQATTERFMKAVDDLGYKVTTERSRSGL